VIGNVLGERYRVTARIGQGGMADVFAAVDERMDRTVALKVLRADGSADPAAFLDELQAQARVCHDAVVRLYDAGVHGELAYLVMEYVSGSSLKAVIGHGPIDPDRVADIGTHVAAGLAAAHELGVVHRDVKPANVLIDADGRVQLADFGIARLSEPAVQSAQTGVTHGTAAYLSPEHVTGQPVGPPADVYGLGLVLLEALTGRREFTGPPLEAAVARLSRDPSIPTDLPPGWVPLLRAMTSREPEGRPTAAIVAAQLQRLPAAAPRREDGPGEAGDSARHLRRALIAVGCAVVLAIALLTVGGLGGV
jgi:eukaryotic-like serine/threonine-protein kinase